MSEALRTESGWAGETPDYQLRFAVVGDDSVPLQVTEKSGLEIPLRAALQQQGYDFDLLVQTSCPVRTFFDADIDGLAKAQDAFEASGLTSQDLIDMASEAADGRRH